ncbi:hypothetical protein BC937DRAFT_92113 [Endogone sp. FLAS-F59071]|nr:hypothetical protein BC937DRAFT_92113 [Endogone sp. FLAS-F59071]|eukprot:RUS21611.1 hypothetical protein BC937DRAFT_92113 [Endogone sp. FLAS-F59071]
MDPKDASFLAMLSNPTINPPYSANQSATAAATAPQNRLFEMDQLSYPSASAPATTSAAQSPRVDYARRQLLDAASGLVYITEGEYPLDFALVAWPREHTSSSLQDDDRALPTASEFSQFVLPTAKTEASLSKDYDDDIEASIGHTSIGHTSIGQTCRLVPLAEFFEPLVGGPDPFNQNQRFLQLQDTLVGLFGADGVQVYMVGERKVAVWILGRLRNWDVGPAGAEGEEEEERVLVGLRTYQIET